MLLITDRSDICRSYLMSLYSIHTLSRKLITIFLSLQGGTLNKTTKKSGQEQRDPDREPLTQAEEEPNEQDGDAVQSRSINS